MNPRVAWLAAVALAACAESGGEDPDEALPGILEVTVDRLVVDLVLPGTRARLLGSGFLSGAHFEVSLGGVEDVGPLTLPAERIDDATLLVTFPEASVAALGEGPVEGTLRVLVTHGTARGEGFTPVVFPVRSHLTPSVRVAASAAFPATPFEILGADFLAEGEGEMRVSLSGRLVREADGREVSVEVTDAPALPPRAGRRDLLEVVFAPSWAGIAPGAFEGQLRVTNAGNGWVREGTWTPVRFDLLPPVIEAVDPTAASRGEKIRITGQGFLGGEEDGGYTTLRLEGTFTPHGGAPVAVPAGALEIDPFRLDGHELVFTMQPRFDRECASNDLGARAGLFEGRVTPIIGLDDEVVEGAPAPLDFEIRATRQVVWLRFLPAFTDSLRLFGLRNVSREVEARILEVVRRDYVGINVETRTTEPHDFIDYSIVEIGGPDPNAQQLFGLDNTPGLDRCNARLNDNLAGRNADSMGFGGIFVESFLQLSPSRSADNPLAHPRFDAIFDPVIDEPVEPREYPDGPRAEVIGEAIRTLGSLIGNTATHEIGHSLGLPAIAGCGEYHNPPGPLQIMDCGQDRPFEERAELDGHPPAEWMPADRAYLESILPVDR